MILTPPNRRLAQTQSFFSMLLIGLPLLSVALSLLGWLRYGIDIPYMDDWRPYILNEAGSFAPEVLFRPTNDTLSPIGLALDSAALRLLGGNSIAYQAISMPVVLLSLLGLQWLLLRHVLRDRALTACAFCFTLLMLQPYSYWGEQNLAFHQAIPLICILASLYLVIVSKVTKPTLIASLIALGLISGFTYISGAFCYLVCGIALAWCALGRSGDMRTRLVSGGVTMTLAGLITSIPQFWALAFYQKGTHRPDAPMAYPYESDFWFYLSGKVGRSLLLPISAPLLSLVLTLIAIGFFLALLYVAFRATRRQRSSIVDDAQGAAADGFVITFSLSAVIAVYLLMVAAGRTNLRDPSMTSALQIFAFGYLRFHFFWVTLLWPWAAALVLTLTSLKPSEKFSRWLPYAVTAAFAIFFVSAGALSHFKAFRDMSAFRSEGLDCLRKTSEAMKPMVCGTIELRDLRPALRVAERENASFTRYVRSGVSSATPAESLNTGIINIEPGTYIDGNFIADRSGAISSMAVPIGNYSGMSDGELEISVCDPRRCVSGSSDLASSSDNNYFEVRFSNPVSAEQGDRVLFRIRTLNATQSVAVWTASHIEGSAEILRVHNAGGADRSIPGQTIRIETWYSR